MTQTVGTFSQAKSRVADWLARDDLDGQIENFLFLAQNKLRRIRTRHNEVALSSAIASGTISLPTRYMALKYAYIDGSPVQWLERKSPEWIYRHYPTRAADGLPVAIAREASTFIFGPFPDDSYTVKGVYWESATLLSTSNETNWITENFPGAFIFGALLEAAPYISDDARVALWQSKYEEEIASMTEDSDYEDFSGSTLATTPG